jgi:predicted acylesterase/phospholipase RssA
MKPGDHLGMEKTALVLAGGGLTGAVYEIGALRAIDDLLMDRKVTDFDIFVGTSAGAFVGALLANGINPEAMMQSMDGSHPDVHSIEREHIFNVKRSELARAGARLPEKVLRAWMNYLGNPQDMTLFDFFWSLLEALPSGFYDGTALGDYVDEVIQKAGKSNAFHELEKDLFIVATDLDSGERKVFSSETPDVPISAAVSASSALPIVYKPVRINDRDYIDGGLRGNASLDIAIEQGATMVVCINPMVPFDNTDHRGIPGTPESGRGRFLSDLGVNFIANQVTRIFTHASIRYHIKQLRRSHPEVDIILVEPRPDDYRMFFNNPMRYSARLDIAQHGFESVTLGLAEDYPMHKDTLARHGITISRRLVIQELQQIIDSGYDPGVIREVLEARTLGCAEHQRKTVACRLNQALDNLEAALSELEAR